MAKRYYFLGIGGISMSSLAIFLKQEGCFVRGSDEKTNPTRVFLSMAKIKVDRGLNKKEINRADVKAFGVFFFKPFFLNRNIFADNRIDLYHQGRYIDVLPLFLKLAIDRRYRFVFFPHISGNVIPIHILN